MEKQYLLFGADGASFHIADPELFFSSTEVAVLKAYYVINYHHFVSESTNRFLKTIKHQSGIVLIEESIYENLQNTINLFRNCKQLSESDIAEIEEATLMLFFNVNTFSNS